MEKNCLNCKRGSEDSTSGENRFLCYIDEDIECVINNPDNYICKRHKLKKPEN